MPRIIAKRVTIPEKFLNTKFVNTNNFAEIMGVTPTTISNWKRQNRVTPSVTDGKIDFFSIEYIKTILEEVYNFGRPLVKE